MVRFGKSASSVDCPLENACNRARRPLTVRFTSHRPGNQLSVKDQLWRGNGAFRYLVGGLTGFLTADLLLRVLTGDWVELRVTIVFLAVVLVVTILRLLVAYWDTKDAKGTTGRDHRAGAE